LGQLFDRSGTKIAARTLESDPALLPITGVHPAVIKIAMSAVVFPRTVLNFGQRKMIGKNTLGELPSQSSGGMRELFGDQFG